MKVAAIMEDRQGRIDGDDLIAASFLAEPPLDKQARRNEGLADSASVATGPAQKRI